MGSGIRSRCRALWVGLIALAMAGAAPAVQAQDLGGLFKSMVGRRTNVDDIVGAIKSIADVSLGQVAPGATTPADADGKVILYRTAWCGYCKQAAAHMQHKSIPFVERDIEANAGYKAEYARLGGKGVPYILFGQKTMVGFAPAAFDRNYEEFQRTAAARAAPSENVAAPPVPPTAAPARAEANALQAGDVLVAKIPGVKVYRQPARQADLVILGKTDEVIYMGEERDGMVRVTTSRGEGWIDRLVVKRQ